MGHDIFIGENKTETAFQGMIQGVVCNSGLYRDRGRDLRAMPMPDHGRRRRSLCDDGGTDD